MRILSSVETKEIAFFSVTVIALSSLICLIAYLAAVPDISILTVLTPSILALILTAVTRGKSGVYELFVRQTVRKTALKWILISLLGIPVLAALAILTSVGFDVSKLRLRTTQLLPQMIIIVLIAVGEEYGWRGFLLPRLLKNLNLLYSSILLGLIWGVWHFPAYLIGAGVPLDMPFWVFLLWVVVATMFISWIYYYTESVLTSILVHISANAVFNYFFLLPEFTGSMSRFWILIIYVSVLMGAVFLIRKSLESLITKG